MRERKKYSKKRTAGILTFVFVLATLIVVCTAFLFSEFYDKIYNFPEVVSGVCDFSKDKNTERTYDVILSGEWEFFIING